LANSSRSASSQGPARTGNEVSLRPGGALTQHVIARVMPNGDRAADPDVVRRGLVGLLCRG